ncbi:MAG: peptidoglycan DD-metalloendopeptidase family protein [Blastochloris sp.]|nr:peptidoglycan DD-metalloendopeptidase family protein [Blastochloris sp.]
MVASIVWANDLQNGDLLAVGRELRIPRISGIPHVVQQGDTIESIARAFQVSPEAITLFKANDVRVGDVLDVGRELFVPGATRGYPTEFLSRYGDERAVGGMQAVTAGVVREGETNLRSGPSQEYPRLFLLDAGQPLVLVARHADWLKVDAASDGTGWVRADLLNLPQGMIDRLPETNDFPPPPPVWVWPTNGRITSEFGYRTRPFRGFHDGLDIANRAGTLIVAARRGTVFEAGWCSGFGYCVKIDHGDGMTTIYGHMLRKPPVRAGEVVDAGSTIGLMGSTYDRRGGGYSTGVHLHFTVKVNGKAVNPMRFLP